MDMDGEPSVLAEVPASRGSRLAFSWGAGNEIFCCDLGAAPSTASCVQWGCPTAAQRRIAYDTVGRYSKLEQRAGEPGTVQDWAQLREFTAAVSEVLAAGDAAEPGDAEEVRVLQERALWELLALFSLHTDSGEGIGGHALARWLHGNDAAVADKPGDVPLPPALLQQLQEASLPEAHSQYWPTLARLCAVGRLAAAVTLLGLHSAWLRWDGAGQNMEAMVETIDAITLLLKRFPTLRGCPIEEGQAEREMDSLQECLTYRQGWQAQCSALLANSALWTQCTVESADTAAGLRSVLAILAGSDEAVAGAAKGWPERLVGRLLHVHPGVASAPGLRQLLARCVDGTEAGAFQEVLAATLDALCDADAQTVMRAASSFASDWFMAHAPAVLAASAAGAQQLARDLPHRGGTQVEFYSMEYAAALAPHPLTWPLAAAYLAWCPVHGQAAFQALVRALPLDAGDFKLALRAAELCDDHGMVRLAEDVCRMQGVLSWEAGMEGAAVTWLSRARDLPRLDASLRQLVGAVWESTHPSEEGVGVLEALQPALDGGLPGSGNVTVLRVHRLLHSAGTRGTDLHAAVGALAQLSPSLRDLCLPMVLSNIPVSSASGVTQGDCLELLCWLEEAAGGGRGAGDPLAHNVTIARLSLTRLLAAAHMSECRV